MVQTRVDYRNGSRLPAQECNRAFIKATLSQQPDPLAVRSTWQEVGYAETNVAVRFGICDRRVDWMRRNAATYVRGSGYTSVTGYSARVRKSDGYRVIGSMCWR